MAHVLVVEGDLAHARCVLRTLAGDGHTTDVALSCCDASSALHRKTVDLLLVDWILPDGEGLQVLRSVRASGVVTPVIMLTNRGSVENKLRAFGEGADDCLDSALDPRELLARVAALIRRTGTPVVVGPIRLFVDRCSVEVNGVQVMRGDTLEFRLLRCLAEHRNRVARRSVLCERLWRTHAPADPTHALDVHVANLRKRLETAGTLIETVRGQGFRLRDGQ